MHPAADPADPATPRHLLVLDPEIFSGADPSTVRCFVDCLGQVRRETVFALLGDGIPDGLVLPQPDYLISDEGRRIVRHPAGDAVDDWPPPESGPDEEHRKVAPEGGGVGPRAHAGGPDEGGAVMHLAAALMVPTTKVHVVAGPTHRKALIAEGQALAVGIDDPPEGAIPLQGEGAAGVNQALQESALFLRPAGRHGDLVEEAFERAVESLRRNVTPMGFTAASVADNRLKEHESNYAAIWSRDGVMTGLWTLCLHDDEINACFRRTLESLAAYQSPPGQIPANVRLDGRTAEYAGLGGISSIDAVLWWVIGVSRYSFSCRDRELARKLMPATKRAMSWLAAHDSNNDGLLEIPEASDWMDLFPRSYNVLYDEVLWYQACKDHASLLEALAEDASGWTKHAETLKRRILEVFWPSGRHLMEIAGSTSGRFSSGEGHYLLSHVTPFDYSWRCDVGANLLAALTDLLDEEQCERLFTFLWGVGVNSPSPVVCLYPSVQSGADDWKDYFIVNFLNLPDHYHNGGIWPFIGGLWVRFLYKLGRTELAHRELAALAETCRRGIRGEWEFNEWLHGRTGRPMGKAHQAWTAASYIKAYRTLTEEMIPAVFDPLDPEALAP